MCFSRFNNTKRTTKCQGFSCYFAFGDDFYVVIVFYSRDYLYLRWCGTFDVSPNEYQLFSVEINFRKFGYFVFYTPFFSNLL